MIRPAVPADAEALCALQLRAWLRAYSDFVDHEVMQRAAAEGESPAAWTERVQAGERVTRVWDQDGLIAGLVTIDGEAAEITALYTDPPAQGAGVGSALLAVAEDELRALGRPEAQVRVLAANEGARAFYAGRGWTLAGDWEPLEGAWAPGVRMRKAL